MKKVNINTGSGFTQTALIKNTYSSQPTGNGAFLVRFFDFDGTILKQQRVNSGENATAPAVPYHQYLTFNSWNNTFTGITSDIDTGAIYDTTDGKSYLFITLTTVTGLSPTLYLNKSTTSLMTINWGDGQTSTSTTSGNFNLNHTYSVEGNYIITVDNSLGGTYSFGNGTDLTVCFYGYTSILSKLYFGNNLSSVTNIYNHKNIKYISVPNYITSIGNWINCFDLNCVICGTNISSIGGNTFQNCFSLIYFIVKIGVLCSDGTFQSCPNLISTNTFPKSGCAYTFFNNSALNKIINIPSTVTSITTNTFYGCNRLGSVIFPSTFLAINGNTAFAGIYNLYELVFNSITPPSLSNTTVFQDMTPICKIYVPDASVNAYKTATNWSTYSSYITGISTRPNS